MDSIENLGTKRKLLVMLYFSYCWISTRRHLLKDSEKIYNKSIRRTSDLRTIRDSSDEPKLQHIISEKINLPDIPLFGKIYFIISTLTHILLIFQSILALIMVKIPYLKPFVLYLSCYEAKFMVQKDFNPQALSLFCTSVCGSHLVWRFIMIILKPELNLSIIPFIMSDKKMITNSMEKVDIKRHQRQLDLDPLFRSSYIKLNVHSTSTLMNPRYLLRLNRTLEARERLLNIIDEVFNKSLKLFILSGLIFLPTGIKNLLFEHESMYIGCESNFGDLRYFIRLFLSLLVSSVVYFDSIVAIFITTGFGRVLLFDLSCYWKHISVRLEKLVISMPEFKNVMPTCGILDYSWSKTQKSNTHYHKARNLSLRYGLEDRLFPGCSDKNDKETKELHSFVADFFNQLRNYDKYLSSLMLFVLIIWFFNNALLTLCGLQLGSGKLLIRSIQIIGSIVVMGITVIVIRLKQETCSSYPILCTLMCLDQSKNKRSWKNLLKYYTEKPRYGVTLMYNEIYTFMTFIKFFSYTLTFIYIVDSLKQQMRH